MSIKIGLFKEFKGEDSILISTDINGIIELETVFNNLSKEVKEYNFENLKNIDKTHFLDIVLYTNEINSGLNKINEKYEWKVNKEKWNIFRQKLTGMIQKSHKCHSYLDSGSEKNKDFQVIISLNEYDDVFWNKLDKTNEMIKICDECNSEYYAEKSIMENLCPNCAHLLYGYENCNHKFKDGRCIYCYWNGNISEYLK